MIDLNVPAWWLEQAHFRRGNPFSVKEADTDPFLEPCFQEKAYFYDMRGDIRMPRTAFLIAERGCGKSANRRILEQQCRDGKLGGLILAVPYLEFSLLLEKMTQENPRMNVRLHIDEILKRAVPALLALLKDNVALIEQLYAEGYRKLFKWFLNNYTDVLTEEGMDLWLRQVGLLSRSINAKAIFACSQNNSGQSPFEKGTIPGCEIVILLIEMINQETAGINIANISHIALFQRFIELIVWLGIDALYVFVDRIDEAFEMANHPENGANLIEPMVADLHVMEMPNVAFKFFIPSDIAHALMAKPSVRVDRLLFREVKWSIDDLIDMLERRLHVYSEGVIPNLEQLSAPDLVGVSRSLAEQAQGSPRNLLRLGEWLLHHHVKRGKGQRSINQEDLRAAFTSFQAEQTLKQKPITYSNDPVTQEEKISTQSRSELRLDEKGMVWRSGTSLDIKLSRLEYQLLQYLLENPNRLITRDELIIAIYGEEAGYSSDDRALYALIGRLRKKIEENPDEPHYIITVQPLGYRLNPLGGL